MKRGMKQADITSFFNNPKTEHTSITSRRSPRKPGCGSVSDNVAGTSGSRSSSSSELGNRTSKASKSSRKELEHTEDKTNARPVKKLKVEGSNGDGHEPKEIISHSLSSGNQNDFSQNLLTDFSSKSRSHKSGADVKANTSKNKNPKGEGERGHSRSTANKSLKDHDKTTSESPTRKAQSYTEKPITSNRKAEFVDSDEEDLPPVAIKSNKKPKQKVDEKVDEGNDGSTGNMTPEEKKRRQSSNYFKFMSRGGPKNLGSKELPIGAPSCLAGLTFVTTGVLDSFERDDIVSTVTKYGGRVTGSVSRKTSYLLVGNEPGESKISKAKQLNIPQMSEDEFLEFISKTNEGNISNKKIEFFGVDEGENNSNTSPSTGTGSAVSKESTQRLQVKTTKRSRADIEENIELPLCKIAKNESGKIFVDSKLNEKPFFQKPLDEGILSKVDVKPATITSMMWVDKYKPTTLKNIIGQGGDKSNAKRLLKWLENWFSYHGKLGAKIKSTTQDPEGKTFKAALLSGPPGIGKTTTAHMCCRELGYDYFELNASDTRNKKGLHEILQDALSSEALLSFKKRSRRHVVIMDEVDGMSGNEDRGGIQEFIALIKTSRVPIICICNDRMHPKIRSLGNYCFDLRFTKPTNEQLKAMVQSLCFKETMKLPADSVQQLINSTDHDVRQILHQLQLIKESSTPGSSLFNPKKDLRFGPWDVCRKVFSASEHRGMSFQDKSNLFFQDYNIGPLFVQENYLKWTPATARSNRHKHMDCLVRTAESLARGDLVENLIRRSNNWSLLPTQAIFSSVLPGEFMEGDDVSGITFPQWLGHNSHQRKMSRLLQQLQTHVHLHISGSLEALNMDYLPYLHGFLVNPLRNSDIETSTSLMQDYSLLREDFDSIIELSKWNAKADPLEGLDSKVKAAFTRQVNKEILPYATIKAVKARSAAESQESYGSEGYEEGEDDGDMDEEDSEAIGKDAMIKVRSAKKSDKSDSQPRQSSSKSSSTRSKKSNSTKSTKK